MYVGTVKTVIVARGFGFIAVPGMKDIFFHAYDVSDDIDFDETLQERRVEFDIVDGEKGPRAALVRPASEG